MTQIPASIIEAFVPGYSIISKLLYESLGFDITFAVSLCLLVSGLITFCLLVWKHGYSFFEAYFTSFICTDADDDIYDHIMEWLSEQSVSTYSRSLMAKTARGTSWESENSHVEEELDSTHFLNFSNWDAKGPPSFQPFYGDHIFRHRGRYFLLNRNALTRLSLKGQFISQDETITLRCFGRSTQPVKDLIDECGKHCSDKGKYCTTVRRPAPKDHRDRGRSFWSKVATRPSRPIHTIVLEYTAKDNLLRDINEYLHPATSRWYAHRGIPYRRGYLPTDHQAQAKLLWGGLLLESLVSISTVSHLSRKQFPMGILLSCL